MPRYANSYDVHGNRTQLLLEPGDTLPLGLLQGGDQPRFADTVDVLLYAPAFHELPAPPTRAIPARIVGVSLQGLLRAVTTDLEVLPHPDPWGQVEPWLPLAHFAFFSEEDTRAGRRLAEAISRSGVRAFLTRGYRGAVLCGPEGVRELDAVPAQPTDPTGAGDCFSTAFLVRYAETADLDQAIQFALAAGAIAVEGPGLSAVPTRPQVLERLAKVAA